MEIIISTKTKTSLKQWTG